MKIERFEDIESWKEARDLVKNVYAVFSGCKDYSFRDQIQRAAVSVMTNIAEGFDRGGNKEFIHFLTIARGSLSEVRSLSYAAMDIGYLQDTQAASVQEKSIKLGNLINGFIRYLNKTDRKK
jgi:four helix bundle protein